MSISLNQAAAKSKRKYITRVTPIEPVAPPGYEKAQIIRAGRYVSVRHMARPVLTHVKKLSKTHYKDLKTGEIREYMPLTPEEKSKVRKSALKRTFGELRNLIRANFEGNEPDQLFITLTYGYNMRDASQLHKDFETFMKRLEYAFPQHTFAWIAVMEPHGSGIWHVHLLLKSLNQPILYIDNKRLAEIWRHGMTDTQRLKCNDAGAYYSAYFTGLISQTQLSPEEMELLECEETGQGVFEAEKEMTSEELTKAHIKGARLHFYPPHFKFYRCSRNITRPEKYTDYLHEVQTENTLKACYESSHSVDKIHLESTEDHQAGEVENLNKIYRATYAAKGSNLPSDAFPPLAPDNMVIKAIESIYAQIKLKEAMSNADNPGID